MEEQVNVIGLIRVSTIGQAMDGRSGVTRQREAIADTCARHNWNLTYTLEIKDKSGTEVQTDPGFIRAMDDLKKPEIAGVVMAEQSRLFRPGTWKEWGVLDHFGENQKFFATPSDITDLSTSGGRMAAGMKGLMAGEELHLLKERTMAGKARKRAEGKHPGGYKQLPRGVRYVKPRTEHGKVIEDQCHWEIDEVAKDAYLKAVQMLFAGKTYGEIAEGVGGYWKEGTIRQVLANSIWKGIRSYPKVAGVKYKPKATEKNPDPKMRRKFILALNPHERDIQVLPPVVGEEVWDRIQALLVERSSRKQTKMVKNRTDGRPQFLAQGLVYCGGCGAKAHQIFGSTHTTCDYYRCSARTKGQGPMIRDKRRGTCGSAKNLRRVLVDPAIERLVSRYLLDQRFIVSILTAMEEQVVIPDTSAAKRQQALAAIQGKRDKLITAMLAGAIKAEDLRRHTAPLDAEQAALEAIAPMPIQKLDTKRIAQAIVNIFASFHRLTFDQKRDVLRAVLRQVYITPDGITGVQISGNFISHQIAIQPEPGGKAAAAKRADKPALPWTHGPIRAIPDITLNFPQAIELSGAIQ
jgi:DNA invertase Pin-like site-specific DNA recombinase